MTGGHQPSSASVGSQPECPVPGWSLVLSSFHPEGLQVAEVNLLPVTREESIGALNLSLALGCDKGEG